MTNNLRINKRQVYDNSDLQPRSEPALEQHSRAASSVSIMYHSSSPNTGSNSKGGQIKKISCSCWNNKLFLNLKLTFYFISIVRI